MPRPRHCRFVKGSPVTDYFKPRGIPLRELEEVCLTVEGLEALRLADLEGLTASRAAEDMKVSRHTFGRVLAEARKTVADALFHGKALSIAGGSYAVLPESHAVTPRYMGNKAGGSMSIIAISSEGPALESQVDPRFGRAGGFVIINTDTDELSYIDNGESQTRAQGAGIETAERLAEAGVGVVLSGYVGPKAFAALKAANIKVCQDLEGMSVGEALSKFKAGEAPFAEAPNK